MDTLQWPDRPFQQLQNVSPQTFCWSQHHHFLLIYILTKMWYWNQLLKNAHSIKVLKLITNFFLSLFPFKKLAVGFSATTERKTRDSPSSASFTVPLQCLFCLWHQFQNSLTNCNPVTSPCKSLALLPCLTTQNSANPLHRGMSRAESLGIAPCSRVWHGPVNIYSHTGSCKDNTDGQAPSPKINISINQIFLTLVSWLFCCDFGIFPFQGGK